MKKLLKVLKITGISLLILLGIAFALPLVFKKQIVAKVKKEINANLMAVVDFKTAVYKEVRDIVADRIILIKA